MLLNFREICYYNVIKWQDGEKDNNTEGGIFTENIGYRDILLQYINRQKAEQPILTEQLVQYAVEFTGLEKTAVRKAVNVNMARLEKAGHVARVEKGVYCRKIKTPFGYYTPDRETLFVRQLLFHVDDVIGYETGLSALNRMGLVSQMPKRKCIATNLYNKKIPSDILIEVRKPSTPINAVNYRYLQLLDAIQNLDSAPVDAAKPGEVIRGAARDMKLDTDTLILTARKHYNQKTLLRTIDIMLEEMHETA